MRKVILVTLVGIFMLMGMCVEAAFCGTNNSNSAYTISQTLTFDQADLSFQNRDGYDMIELEECGILADPGMPLLPSKVIKVALPNGMAVTGVEVTEVTRIQIDGDYNVYPSQPPKPLSARNHESEFVAPNEAIYQSSSVYPENAAEFQYQTDLAGQAMAVIRINPVEYIPAEGTIRLLSSISIRINGNSGYECGDYLPAGISESSKAAYEKMARDMVNNPQDVSLVSRVPTVSGVDPGDYDYVIITSSSYEDDFQPLADWKTKKGVRANIVSTNWIYNYGGYSGSNTQKIRSFVQDAYNTWGATYFLIGGDTGVVPTGSSYYVGDNIPNDTYYGDFDSDFTCEVHVGRAAVTNYSGFVDKVLTYEKDPPMTNYCKKAAMFGFDLDWYTEAEECKDDIDDYYIPADWTMTNVYDSHGGNHETNVKNAINAGQNLINHADHCFEDEIGTGISNHGYYLNKSEVDAFYNGDKQGIFYSMGCWPAAYDYSNCIAEHYIRDSNGGGVAFVGNSRYGWYYQGSYNTLSMQFDRLFFRSLFDQDHYILGECFSDHKNDGPTYDDYEKYIYTELTLLGDPEMPIWTENPSILSATHPSSLPTGPSSFQVRVTSGGSGVYQALVCLWKGDEVYATGTTNASGYVTLNPTPETPGTMYVTASKHNYIAYEGEASVTSGSDVGVDMVPDEDPVFVPPGGSFSYTGTLVNYSGETQVVDVWVMIDLRPGSYGPVQRANNVTMYAYQTRSYPVTQHVPQSAPPGAEYGYVAYCGDYPSSKMDSAWFDFWITYPRGGDANDWLISGWFDDISEPMPTDYALAGSYPNPFNATTTITYQLPQAGKVTLDVYNLMGQKAAVLVDEYNTAGTHNVKWDASEFSSGVYYYRLETPEFSQTKKMLLVK